MGIMNSVVSIFHPVKREFSNFYLSLHHSNNPFKNIHFFFCFPLLNSVLKKLFLGRKNVVRAFPPPLHLPSYAYDRLLIKKIKTYPEDSNHFYVKNTTNLKMSLS